MDGRIGMEEREENVAKRQTKTQLEWEKAEEHLPWASPSSQSGQQMDGQMEVEEDGKGMETLWTVLRWISAD